MPDEAPEEPPAARGQTALDIRETFRGPMPLSSLADSLLGARSTGCTTSSAPCVSSSMGMHCYPRAKLLPPDTSNKVPLEATHS